MFSTICLVASFLLWLSYILVIYVKFKPDCISRSYYLTKNRNTFSVWIILVSFLIFPAWVEISPISFQFLPFLSVIALAIVGMCPKYLESDRVIHIIAASVTGILSIIWSVLVGVYIVPIVLLIILLILYICSAQDWFYWAECSAFLNIYISIILQ